MVTPDIEVEVRSQIHLLGVLLKTDARRGRICKARIKSRLPTFQNFTNSYLLSVNIEVSTLPSHTISKFSSLNQNYFYQSATTSRAWPLKGALLIPPALLVVAD